MGDVQQTGAESEQTEAVDGGRWTMDDGYEPQSATVHRPPSLVPQDSALSSQLSALPTRNSELGTRNWALRRHHLWILAPLAIIWTYECLQKIEPFDFWWNVASGKIMFETGRFLGEDVLVYTPVREPYSNPQWLAQLLFYAFYAVSPFLLIVLRAAIITATYALLYAICYRRCRSLAWSACAVLVAFLTGLTNYGMRPQLFAFLPFMLFFWLLDGQDEHPRRLWLLIPIMIFWVNVHGSYFLGWALLGIYGLGMLVQFFLARRKDPSSPNSRLTSHVSRLVPMVLAALAAFVNPYGVGIVSYFFAATNDATARSLNVEWQPPTLYNGTGILFFANVAIFLVALFVSRRRLGLVEGLLLVAFGYLSLLSIRNVIWWAWISAPSLALSLAVVARAWLGRRQAASEEAPASGEIPLLNWLIAGLLVFVMVAALPFWQPNASAFDPSTPVAVAVALAQTPDENRIFNYMEWGGYLEWRLFPVHQMFIDGRFEAREPQVWEDYLAISRGVYDWQERLDRYQVRTLALNNDFHQTLIQAVSASPRWRQVYSDEQGTIFVAQ